MSEVLVRADAVSRVFREGGSRHVAIAPATFTVESDQQIALEGPSGSGKSTLLHLLAGLDRPSSGTLEWPALGARADLKPGPVAMAFQGQSLLPALTVKENVALPLLLLDTHEPSALEAAAEMLELLELTGVADNLPQEISGGQQQRASLARALVGRPRLVLVDEPTGQQDRATAGRVVEIMLARARGCGAAVVVATHDPSVVERLSHRWTLADGRLGGEMVVRLP